MAPPRLLRGQRRSRPRQYLGMESLIPSPQFCRLQTEEALRRRPSVRQFHRPVIPRGIPPRATISPASFRLADVIAGVWGEPFLNTFRTLPVGAVVRREGWPSLADRRRGLRVSSILRSAAMPLLRCVRLAWSALSGDRLKRYFSE